MDVKYVGKNIARFRKAAGMTQIELAEKLNVIDKTVSRWECGYGLPDMSMLVPMAEIFGVPVEAIIDENYEQKQETAENNKKLSEDVPVEEEIDERDKPDEKRGRARVAVIISIACALVVALTVAAVALTLPRPSEGEREVGIEWHCWETALMSEADSVLITAFGSEEIMSLELYGDEGGGDFICEESWRETNGAKILDCLVAGTYKTQDGKIYFYANTVSDPDETAKLRTCSALGIEYFVAEYTTENGEFDVIRFADTVKNSEKSAFGRWTKYKKYFSAAPSEIRFERVEREGFSEEQFEKFPELVLAETNHLTFNVTLNKRSYFVGEKFLMANISATFGPVYDLKDVLGECEVNLKDKYITANDDVITVDYVFDGKTYHRQFRLRIFRPSWYYAEVSTAKDVMFTCYSSLHLLCFGCMELFDDGTFVYNETYGRTSFTTAATITGTYVKADGEIAFTAVEYASNVPDVRFATNVSGVYYRARYEEVDGEMTSLVFLTADNTKAFLGTRSDDSLDDTLSEKYGEVRFERANGGVFSDKIVGLFDYYLELYGS